METDWQGYNTPTEVDEQPQTPPKYRVFYNKSTVGVDMGTVDPEHGQGVKSVRAANDLIDWDTHSTKTDLVDTAVEYYVYKLERVVTVGGEVVLDKETKICK